MIGAFRIVLIVLCMYIFCIYFLNRFQVLFCVHIVLGLVPIFVLLVCFMFCFVWFVLLLFVSKCCGVCVTSGIGVGGAVCVQHCFFGETAGVPWEAGNAYSRIRTWFHSHLLCLCFTHYPNNYSSFQRHRCQQILLCLFPFCFLVVFF